MVRSRCAAVLVAAFWGLLGTTARAQGTVDLDRMIDSLKNGTDFRVRTQAALALGASKSPRATEPLCSGLADANTTVRAAAAAALGKLQQGGAECLEARLATEPSPAVKASIQHALDLVRGGAAPVIGPDTKFYISIGKLTDKSGRTGDGVERMMRTAMGGAAGSLGIVIAPVTETPTDAKKRIASRAGIRSFFLSPRIGPIEYTGGDLKVRLDVAVFTYPDKNMIGSFAVPLTQPDTPAKDPASEDDLIKMASERAMERLEAFAARVP
jgi:hypothetical protein